MELPGGRWETKFARLFLRTHNINDTTLEKHCKVHRRPAHGDLSYVALSTAYSLSEREREKGIKTLVEMVLHPQLGGRREWAGGRVENPGFRVCVSSTNLPRVL